MISPMGSALELFVNRLAMRSVLTQEEKAAVLDLSGQVKQFAPHIDIVRLGEEVDHACLVVGGLWAASGKTETVFDKLPACTFPVTWAIYRPW